MSGKRFKIAAILGDGIGLEVIEQGIAVLERAVKNSEKSGKGPTSMSI